MYIRKVITVLKRMYQKKKVNDIISRLPADVQIDIMHELFDIVEIQDRDEQIKRTKVILRPYKERMIPVYDKKIKLCISEFEELLKKVQSSVVAPQFPIPQLNVNYETLDQRVKAKLTIDALENEVMNTPKSNLFNLFAALVGICFSFYANYVTVIFFLGSDSVGGNEFWSTVFNICFALAILIIEAIGLHLVMHYLPRNVAKGFSRLCGLIGAILIVASICTFIFSRAEIGSKELTKVEDKGNVE